LSKLKPQENPRCRFLACPAMLSDSAGSRRVFSTRRPQISRIFADPFVAAPAPSFARDTTPLECVVHHPGLAPGDRLGVSFARRLMQALNLMANAVGPRRTPCNRKCQRGNGCLRSSVFSRTVAPRQRDKGLWDCTCMAESGLPRGLTKQTQFSSTMIYPDRLPIPPRSASIVQMGGPVRLNSRRDHRPAVLAGDRYGNGAPCLGVCDDPMRRGQTGFG